MECFVYQKHIDLHAVSALEAIHGFMKLHHCKSLRRFVHWIIDVDTNLSSSDFFSNVTSKSYYLLNPNKEAFLTELVDVRDDNVESVFIDVFPKVTLDHSALVTKINQHCGTAITSIEKRITWQCNIDSSQNSQEFVLANLLPSDQQAGILANPIYESFCLLTN
tara:strand:- start:2838 stop:3329 length:492 start_codon:yes stop_codon:yes gene_type:complete